MIQSKKVIPLILCLLLIFSNTTTAFSFNENTNQNPSISVEVASGTISDLNINLDEFTFIDNTNQNPSISVEVASGTISDLNINLDEFTFIDNKSISIYKEESQRQRLIPLPAGGIAIASVWHSPTSMTILVYNMSTLHITGGGIEGLASMYNGRHQQYKSDFNPIAPGGAVACTINSSLGEIKSVSYNCVVYMPESVGNVHYLSGTINKPF